jgi:hypothetical protein
MKAKNSDLSSKEKKIITFAQKAFNKTLAEFYFPPLNEPNYVFDYSNKEGFYIDPIHSWQITLNLANCPVFLSDDDYIKFFYAITLHEVSHYQIIPYDGIINAKLLRAALSHTNETFAPIIVNLFSDLIIDKKLYMKHPKLISWELKTTFKHIQDTYQKKISNFTLYLFRVYEILLKISILDHKISDELNLIAIKSEKIISDNFENDALWERKVSKLSLLLKELIQDNFNLVREKYIKKEGFIYKRFPGKKGYVEIPEDIIDLMDNPLESRNIDKLKRDNDDDLIQKAEEFAKETPYSEFGAPARQAGILFDLNPLATWYRGKAKDLIEIKIYEEEQHTELPIYPETWRLGDPIDTLDITQTLLNNPIIIPNITTRKWLKMESPTQLQEKKIPDLLIVLDSSGSMNWNYKSKRPKGTYHTALIAAFAALHYVARKSIKFSVINFSNRTDLCDWTYNYEEAEKTLLRYQGGGTQLPLAAISKQCQKANKKVLVFIITDFGIYNWKASKKTFLSLIDQGHHIIGFFIGSSEIPKTKFKDLLPKMSFYPVKDPKELIALVIKEIIDQYQ